MFSVYSVPMLNLSCSLVIRAAIAFVRAFLPAVSSCCISSQMLGNKSDLPLETCPAHSAVLFWKAYIFSVCSRI